MRKKFVYIIIAFLLYFCSSCRKYLSAIPDTSLTIPTSIQDLQGILDFYSQMNESSYPIAAEVLADDYYLTTENWSGVTDETMKGLYLWQPIQNTLSQWNQPYVAILNTNVVLDELTKFERTPNNAKDWLNIKGSALFFRAYYYYGLSQLFSKPFNGATATSDLGLCLRLNSNQNEASVRATVQQTYQQILDDLKAATYLLPITPAIKSRPSLPAVYGALAKIYLSMRNYDSAGYYADKCINLYGKDSLLNYNNTTDVNPSATAPFKRFNREVIFQMRSAAVPILSNSTARIDSVLYNTFEVGDLRRTAFFKSNGNGSFQFKGDYDGRGTSAGYVFAGIVLDEMYLIRAEAYARNGNLSLAMGDINRLLATRWVNGAFKPVEALDIEDAINIVLKERRKELLRRGTRWTDIRRLSMESGQEIIPRRLINGRYYNLTLHSARYTLKIPSSIILITGIEQNE